MALRRPDPAVDRDRGRHHRARTAITGNRWRQGALGFWTRAALGGLALLALALRGLRLGFQPLWWDEGYSVWFAHHPLADMLRLTALDIHPPLYYALLGMWSQLFGLAPVALRLFSLAAGVVAVPLVYLAGRSLIGRRAGLVAAFLLAINPFHVFYSQEVRMYALAMVWGLCAILFATRWLGMAQGQRVRGSEGRRVGETGGRRVRGSEGWRAGGSRSSGGPEGRSGEGQRGRGLEEGRDGGHWGENAGGRWGDLAGYVVAVTLALYTLYYAGFLVLGLAIAGLVTLARHPVAPRRRGRNTGYWLGAHLVALVLYLPWLRFAAPRLVPYVSQKVVADSDQPLGAGAYLLRHLAAFSAGHLEGMLAPWWPVGLLGLAPLLWILASRLRRRRQLELGRPPDRAVVFLLIVLVVVLVAGWLVNLGFPFFPQRGERLLLIALPPFLLLAAAGITTCRWMGDDAAPTLGRRRTSILLLPYLLLAGLSLSAFYMFPRYSEEDYRPLIGQVTQWGGPHDVVFCVFPWQAGYFWSYGGTDGPQPVLSPDGAWGPSVAASLDDALARGKLWFPEHLALGGLLEKAAEQHLSERAYDLANRWYSPSTRLTGWAVPMDAGMRETGDSGPFAFSRGVTLERATFQPSEVVAANEPVFFDLDWLEAGLSPNRQISLRLADDTGRAWARREVTAETVRSVDRLGLLVSAGTPPGTYQLNLSVRPASGGTELDLLGPDGRPQGTDATLGWLRVTAPAQPPPVENLPIGRPLERILGSQVRFLGFSANDGPVTPGDDLRVNLFWQRLPAAFAADGVDWYVFLQLLDPTGRVVAGWEGPPVAWHGTGAWLPGELVRSQHALRMPALLADGRYRLITGLFDPASGQRLAPQRRWPGLAGENFLLLAEIEIVGRPHVLEPPVPERSLRRELVQLGQLVGYDLPATTVAPGDSVTLTLYWQATSTTSQRLAVFVHLLDPQGEFLGQSDGEPGAGSLPTSSWVPGEYLVDRHELAVRPDAAAGPAMLVVGLYDPASGQRLPWLDGGAEGAAGVLRLPDPITIAGN